MFLYLEQKSIWLEVPAFAGTTGLRAAPRLDRSTQHHDFFTHQEEEKRMQLHIFQDAKLEWRWQLAKDKGKRSAESGDGYRDKDAGLE